MAAQFAQEGPSGGESPGDEPLPSDGEVAADAQVAPAPARLEDVVEGSPFHRVYTTPDGGLSAELFTDPVFFTNEQGLWEPIDLDLVEAGAEELAPRRGPGRVGRPARVVRPGRPVSRVDTAAGQIAVVFPEATGESRGRLTRNGRGLRYYDALTGGRDLILRPTVDGWEEFVVLPDRAAGAGYEVRLRLPDGVTARQGAANVVELVDSAGAVVAVYGGGLAWDRARPRAETMVMTTLQGQTGSVARVRSTVDAAWLADPARVFPVVLDPVYDVPVYLGGECSTSVSTFYACDTYVNSDNLSASRYLNAELRLGSSGARQQGSSTAWAESRTFVKFATDNFGTAAFRYPVASAQIRVWAYDAGGAPQVRRFNLTRLTSSPTSATTWSAQPFYSSTVRSYEDNGGIGYLFFPVTGLVDDWFNGVSTNHGVRIVAASHPPPGSLADTSSFRQLRSANSGYTTAPRLTVDYVVPPTAPGSVALSPGVRTVSATWAAPSSWGDATTANSSYQLQLYQGSGTGSPVGGLRSASRTTTSYSFTGLANNTSYHHRIFARNDAGDSATIASGLALTHDLPTAPRSVTAAQNADQVVVSWLAPSSNGRSAITSYRISAHDQVGNQVGITRTCGATCTQQNPELPQALATWFGAATPI